MSTTGNFDVELGVSSQPLPWFRRCQIAARPARRSPTLSQQAEPIVSNPDAYKHASEKIQVVARLIYHRLIELLSHSLCHHIRYAQRVNSCAKRIPSSPRWSSLL